MLGRIIFCVVITAAVLAVVLLATVSPLPKRSSTRKGPTSLNFRSFSIYIQPTLLSTVQQQQEVSMRSPVHQYGALVFHHRLTVGPENTSGAVGTAWGFVLPSGENSMLSAFDMIHLVFDTTGLSGSLCVEAAGHGKLKKVRPSRHGGREELRVVGGTGMFTFAQGHAIFHAVQEQRFGHGTAMALQLQLSIRFPQS